MKKIYSYDSTDVGLWLTGLEVEGFGKDTKIVITRDGALAEGENGTDGETMISYYNTAMGKAEITLLYGCDWDTALDQMAGMKLPFTFLFFHKESNKVLSTIAWLEEQPSVSLGTKAEDRTWVFGLQNADFSVYAAAVSTISGIQYLTNL